MTGDLLDLAALGPDGEYRTRNREIIRDTSGVPVAESCVVPRLFVNKPIDTQRKLRPLPAAQREAALATATAVFVSSSKWITHALRQGGFRAGDGLYLPTDPTVADDVIRAADLAMVYGGQDVVDRYAQDPRVLTNGPGRTKILITAEYDWREYLDVIVDSIANLGGMACVNA